MIDPAKLAEFDQGRAFMAEVLPTTWVAMYEKLREEFGEPKAWELMKVIVFAQSGGKGITG